MSRAQHTPGPWRVGNGGHSHGTEFEIETAEQDALYLASVHWGDARVESYAPAHHTAEANARLIAATPELLDHAEADVADLAYYIGNPSAWEAYDDKVSEMLRRVVTRARAAIAKARGAA
jgi:hypothetical protein